MSRFLGSRNAGLQLHWAKPVLLLNSYEVGMHRLIDNLGESVTWTLDSGRFIFSATSSLMKISG